MSSSYKFHTACFSTNSDNFNFTSIIKQYLLTANCFDINYLNDNHIEFKNKILLDNEKKISVHNSYYEISSFSKINSICNIVECLIIFFDLEFNESLIELNKILKHIQGPTSENKKIFLIKIYTNESNIKQNLDEESINNSFSNYYLNSEIFTVNMDSSDELVGVIDKLTKITIQEKIDSNNDKNLGNSQSNCLII